MHSRRQKREPAVQPALKKINQLDDLIINEMKALIARHKELLGLRTTPYALMVSNSIIYGGATLTLGNSLNPLLLFKNRDHQHFSLNDQVITKTVLVYIIQFACAYITQRMAYENEQLFVLPDNIENLTNESVRKLKIQLKEKIFILEKNYLKASSISLIYSFFVIAMALVQEFMSLSYPTASSYIFIIVILPALLITLNVIINQNKLPRKLDDSYKIEAQLENQYEEFKKCLPENLCTFDLVAEKDITKSKIAVEISAMPNWKIPKKIIAKIIQNILMTSGITIDSVFKNKIGMFILPSNQLTQDDYHRIKQKIILSLDSYAQRAKFSKQIDDIVAVCSGTKFSVSKKDSEGRFIYEAYLSLPKEMDKIININVLKDLFSKCNVELKNEFSLITGFEAGDQTLLKKLLSSMNSFRAKAATVYQQSIHVPIAALPKNNIRNEEDVPVEKKSKAEILIEEAEKERLKNQATPVKGNWASGSYDSSKPNNTIHPIDGGNRIPKNTFFILSKLKEEDFASIPGAFEKISAAIEKAHFAHSRKDAEGFIFIDRIQVRDTTGRFFNAEAKIKFLGLFGDLRTYAELETAVDGKVLCVIKGYQQHAHNNS